MPSFNFRRITCRRVTCSRINRVIVICALLAINSIAMPSYQQAQQGQADDQQAQPQGKQKKDPKKGQGQNQGQSQNPPATGGAQPAKPPDKPAPLFGGSLNLKSSRQSKDVATLGFNGLDPNGQVQKGFLTSSATAADTAKAQQLSRSGVNQADLAAFLQEGNLGPQSAPSQN